MPFKSNKSLVKVFAMPKESIWNFTLLNIWKYTCRKPWRTWLPWFVPVLQKKYLVEPYLLHLQQPWPLLDLGRLMTKGLSFCAVLLVDLCDPLGLQHRPGAGPEQNVASLEHPGTCPGSVGGQTPSSHSGIAVPWKKNEMWVIQHLLWNSLFRTVYSSGNLSISKPQSLKHKALCIVFADAITRIVETSVW